MLLLVVVGFATLTVLKKPSAPDTVNTLLPGSIGSDVVAANVVASLKTNEKVQAASGAYLAGSGIVLRIAVKNVPASETAAWLAGAMAPMARVLGALAPRPNEQLLALATTSRLASCAANDLIRLKFAASPPKRVGNASRMYRSRTTDLSFTFHLTRVSQSL